MVRKAVLLSTVSLAAAAFALSAHAQDRVVNVYNWSDYIDQSILEEFTAETGIKVVYDVYDSNEMLETKLLAGGSGYDVVVPTASPFMARRLRQASIRSSTSRPCPTCRTCGIRWPSASRLSTPATSIP